MQSILLLGAVQSVFLSLLLITKKSKNITDFILITLLLVVATPLFIYYFKYEQISALISSSQTMPSFMYFINVPIIMTFTPSIYLYIKASLKHNPNFIAKNIIHFAPIFVFVILTLLFVDFKALPSKNFNFFSNKNNLIFLFFTPLTIILAIFYIYQCFILLRQYSKKIKQNYSFIEDIDLNWLKILLIIVASTWILLFPISIIIGRMGDVLSVYKIVLLSITLIVFIVAFFGFKQTDVFINIKNINTNEESNQKQNSSIEYNFNGDVKILTDFMQIEKPYLESRLTIAELANKINWQSHYLSKLLNESMNKNFYEFVNKYRVDEFKNQLEKNNNYTIIAIAYECGFNSKSSFNRIFKEFTGQTPSQYKNSLENSPLITS
ncbi:MAG: helix-turn-helix transcriptional regulator [Bacteroidales bacterium]|nr:helix-turn-helix transcriptional regulator [Bacteroidales bacterium]